MSWLKRFLRTFTSVTKFGDSYFYPLQDLTSIYNNNALLDYLEIPEVNTIINKKALAHSNIIYKVVNKETGEEVDNEINQILKQPNWFQSQNEFIRQSQSMHDIFGNEYIYFISPVGMSDKYMYTIPGNQVEVDDTSDLPFFLSEKENVKYLLKYKGNKKELRPEKLIHLNDNRVYSNDNDNYLEGRSKLHALSAATCNLRAAYESRNVLIERRGALGILVNRQQDGMGASMPLQQKDKDQLKQQLAHYGTMKGQSSWIITNANVDYIQTSMDMKKLMLFEETLADTLKICDAYGVPFELLSSEKGVTFANRSQALKEFYLNTIIPEAQERSNALNKYFDTESQPYQVVLSYNHIDVFNEDDQKKAFRIEKHVKALSTMLADGVINTDEYRNELIKLGVIDE